MVLDLKNVATVVANAHQSLTEKYENSLFLLKHLDTKHWMITNVDRLNERTEKLEDAIAKRIHHLLPMTSAKL